MSGRVLLGTGILGGALLDHPGEHKANAPTESEPLESAGVRRKLLALDAADQSTSAPAERDHLIATLELLIDLGREEVRGLQLLVVQELVWQLSDLEVGTVGKLLAKRKSNLDGPPPRGLHRSLIRIFSAAYMSKLVEAGVSEAEANAQAKAKLTEWARRAGVRLTRSTIMNWRKQLRRPTKDDVEAPVFDLLMQSWRRRPQEMRTKRHADVWLEDGLGPFGS